MAEIENWIRPESVPYPYVWSRFQGRIPFPNGKIPKFRVQDMTEDMLEDAIRLMVEHYIPEEPLSKSLNLKSDSVAVEDFKQVWKAYFGYKMALVCVLENPNELGCKSLPRVVGCNMTGIYIKDRPVVKFAPKSEKSRLIFDIMAHLHDQIDVFEYYQMTECLYSLGLSVHSEFRGQGIGLEIMKARVKLGESAGLKATVGVFSNIASQTVAKEAGFADLFEVMYEDYKIGGKIVFNISPTRSCKIMGMRTV